MPAGVRSRGGRRVRPDALARSMADTESTGVAGWSGQVCVPAVVGRKRIITINGHDWGVTGGEMAIVIAGTREDWPRGTRTLTPHDPIREPNGRTLWFGAGLDPDGEQVWFRLDEDAIGRMPEKTPTARGDRLVDALIVWITPDRQLEPGINRFEVRVSETGDTWIERLQW